MKIKNLKEEILLSKKYRGIIPALITPIDETEKVNEEEFKSIIDHCINKNIHGLFICGTNGEAMGLTQKERNKAIKVALNYTKNRIPIISGVMDTSTQRVIENIKFVEELGGDCVAVTPIFYARHNSQYETIRHFEKILDKTNIDLMIYNIPTFTGLNLTADTVDKIAQLSDRVKGYKDSSGNYGELLKVLSIYKDKDFSVLEGTISHAVSALLMGADGMVPVLAPAFPEIYNKAYEIAKKKEINEAIKYNDIIAEISTLLNMTKNSTAAAKYVISLLGLTNYKLTSPQDVINKDEKKLIKNKFNEIKQYTKS